MNRYKALHIMGLSKDTSVQALKKRYRELMLLTHPDMGKEDVYPYDASQINVAYEYLLNQKEEITKTIRKNSKNSIKWNAPINLNAYAARKIYHTVEDIDGMPLGQAVLDQGKYIWTEDEDFSLFLKSLYHCAKSIIAVSDEKTGRDRSHDLPLLSEITYLLAGQYVDCDMVLSQYAKVVKEGDEENRIYQLDAMLEMKKKEALKKEEILYPSRLIRHRLLLKNADGIELGYLSFQDDRLYYGMIPLFERKGAMVKMMVKDAVRKRMNGKYYVHIEMLIKKTPKKNSYDLDNSNLRIDALLK